MVLLSIGRHTKYRMKNEISALARVFQWKYSDNKSSNKNKRRPTEIGKVTKVGFLPTHDLGGAEGKGILAGHGSHANGDDRGTSFHLLFSRPKCSHSEKVRKTFTETHPQKTTRYGYRQSSHRLLRRNKTLLFVVSSHEEILNPTDTMTHRKRNRRGIHLVPDHQGFPRSLPPNLGPETRLGRTPRI